MSPNNKLNDANLKNPIKKNAWSKASLFLSISPLVIVLLIFLFCLILSGGHGSDNDAGAIWWVFVASLTILIPLTIITSVLAVVFGIIGLKGQKTMFSWSGIILASLNILTILWFFIFR